MSKENLKYDFAVKVWKTDLYTRNLLLIFAKNLEFSENDIQKEWLYIDTHFI